MFEDEHFLKAQALQFWNNYLQTGDMTRSAEQNRELGIPVCDLSDSQKMLVKKLEELTKKELIQCSNPQ